MQPIQENEIDEEVQIHLLLDPAVELLKQGSVAPYRLATESSLEFAELLVEVLDQNLDLLFQELLVDG